MTVAAVSVMTDRKGAARPGQDREGLLPAFGFCHIFFFYIKAERIDRLLYALMLCCLFNDDCCNDC